MNKPYKLAGLLVLCTSLSACLEVEDNSNDELVTALQEQNEILRNQNEQIAKPIVISGSIADLATDTPVNSASIQIRVGAQWQDPIESQDGTFEIANLPSNSNFELVISSPTGEFLDRTYFGTTRVSTPQGITQQHLGIIGVSRGIERRFTVLDMDTNQPVTGLVFNAYSHIGNGSNYRAYAHTSSYDANTRQYLITLPEYINTEIRALLDLNGDNAIDYLPQPPGYRTGNDVYIAANDISSLDTLYLVDNKPIPAQPIELRVSVIDDIAEPIADLELTLDDNINALIDGSYDPDSQQYVFNAELDQPLQVLVPSFTINDTVYASASINVRRNNDGSLYVYLSNAQNNTSYNLAAGTASIDLVVQPRVIEPTFSLKMVAKSDAVNPTTESFKVYYSSPIELLADSVKIEQQRVISVVRGNDDNSDLVLPGTTVITQSNVEIPVTTELQLNDTLLVITPTSPLPVDFDYEYHVGDITEQASGITADVYGDNINYTVTTDASFDIAAAVLDNDNYTTNGIAINTQNTAGVAVSPFNNNRTVYMYFPSSLVNLESFTLSKRATTRNGVITNRFETYRVIENGQIRNVNKVLTTSLAQNETLTENVSYSISGGTTLEDGFWYRVYVGESMSDNLAGSTNEITFEYVYETLDGEVRTGDITLPVR